MLSSQINKIQAITPDTLMLELIMINEVDKFHLFR